MSKLSALKVRNLTTPGRYGDGAGLWLKVRDAEHRSWLFRYNLHGRARAMGIGPYPDVPLAEARNIAHACRSHVRAGVDPIDHRNADLEAKRQAATGITFKQVADKYVAAHEGTWRNEKHRYQWKQTLGVANASMGAQSVKTITTKHVMDVVEPIWRTTPETATRLRGRIEAVIDYATAQGWRTGENPARWRGHLSNLLPARFKVARVKHHAALPWGEIGAFLGVLRQQKSVAAFTLEFVILSAARTGEAIGALWPEIDMDAGIWTVPAARMKAEREHRVPLSAPALAVLRAVLPYRGPAEYVFPGSREKQPQSNMTMMMLLRRMGYENLTVHGFRSTFRDWCSEATAYPGDVAEAALAHTLSSKVEAAYRRGDLFEKRRAMMADWAAYCAGKRI